MPLPDRAWLRPVRRTLTLAWLESLTIRRDPVILAMILLIPTLQVALFGYAIRPLSGAVPIVIARTERDPALVNLLRDSGAFRVVADGLTPAGALAALRSQEALIALVIPPSAPAGDGPKGNATPAAGEDGAVRVLVDDSDPVLTDPALSRLEALYWRRAGEGDPFRPPEPRVERLYNPENRHEWIITPGLSGVVIMISMLMLGALSIVRERERGTWEALLATPVNAAEAIIGKALPYLLLGFVQAVLVIGCSRVLFGLPLRGGPTGLRVVPGRLPLCPSRDGSNNLRGGAQPAPSRAGRRARLPSINGAGRFPVSLREYAPVGATAGSRLPADLLHRGSPRGHVARGGRGLRPCPDPARGGDRRRVAVGRGADVPTPAPVAEAQSRRDPWETVFFRRAGWRRRGAAGSRPFFGINHPGSSP